MNSVTKKYNKAVRFTTALTQSKPFENTLTKNDHKLFLAKITRQKINEFLEIVRTSDKGKSFSEVYITNHSDEVYTKTDHNKNNLTIISPQQFI